MKTETRSEQFQPPSLLGKLLRRLHIDIPLLTCILLITSLSFIILYSAAGQNTDILLRQATRLGVALLLLTLLAQIDPYQFQRASPLLYGLGILLSLIHI